MAVYTHVSDDALGVFLAKYDVGEVLSFKGIAEGVENTNYFLNTSTGSFMLTLYEKRVDPADLPFFLGLMEHLADKAINCPRPIHMRDGAVLGTLAGRPAALASFLDGISLRRPTAKHCRNLGSATAALHEAGHDYGAVRPNALSISSWRGLFENSRERCAEVNANLAKMVQAELDFLERAWPKGLPYGVIHADLFPDNVFFLRDQLTGIIDFYFACNDHFAFDIAICLNAWCFEADHSFNVTKAQGFLGGYQAVRRLDAGEFEALPVLARGAALRFLLTRLFDWLNVPAGALVRPHDPMEFFHKLRFHQSVSSARAYGLDTYFAETNRP